MKYTLIFIDTETTGSGLNDKLIQVAYKTTQGVEVNELFKPDRAIEIEAMAVHHITEKMIAEKPAFVGSPTYEDLKERFLREEVFVAHNAQFDVGMIEREGLKVGPVIDTLKVARHMDPHGKIESYKLQYLRYLLGIEVTATAHDAWGDILVLEQLFYRMLKKLMEEQSLSQDEAIQYMIKVSQEPMMYRTLPFGKYRGRKLEEIASEDPGYLKWLLTQKEEDQDGPDEDWIYTLKHYLHL
jgi:DNA polymerase III epsilon subunit family exonuclease